MTTMESSHSDLTNLGESNQDVNQGGGEQSSAGDVTLETALAEIKRLDAQVRALQSGKDRDKAKMRGEIDKLKKQTDQFVRMKSYLERYETPEEAARQMAIDNLLGGAVQDDESDVSQEADVTSQTPVTSGSVDEELLNLLGVQLDDPELVRRISAGENSTEAAKAVAKARLKAIQAQQQSPPAGIIPVSQGGLAPTAQAALQAQYDQEVAKIRRGDFVALENLKRKYRDKGLPIW